MPRFMNLSFPTFFSVSISFDSRFSFVLYRPASDALGYLFSHSHHSSYIKSHISIPASNFALSPYPYNMSPRSRVSAKYTKTADSHQSPSLPEVTAATLAADPYPTLFPGSTVLPSNPARQSEPNTAWDYQTAGLTGQYAPDG